jgi:putative transposase
MRELRHLTKDRVQMDFSLPGGRSRRFARETTPPLGEFSSNPLFIALRNRYKWGAKKLMTIFTAQKPDWELPSRTAICNILREEGLVKKYRHRNRLPMVKKVLAPSQFPNDVWSADYKGQFRMGNGKYCYPLTVADDYTRYLLECRALSGTTTDSARRIFTRLFQEYGLPVRIRTDNGPPFASSCLPGLSRLSVWWIRLGICPERITPGRPQQNGRHERMHKTLKEKAVKPPADNCNTQQQLFDAFLEEYNDVRPHEGLAMRTPGSLYRPSERKMPRYLPEMEYPPHFLKKFVNFNGCFLWQGKYVWVSLALPGEMIGLDGVDDGLWDVYFGNYWIGNFDERTMKVQFTRERK